jgi:hypothetical protein
MNKILLKLGSALALMLGVLTSAAAQERQAVDLELVLLVDVSSSVNDEEYRLQTNGLAAAFRDPSVRDALARLARRGVAVSVIQWANHENQRVAVDWTLLRGGADVRELARRIAAMARLDHRGHTAIGSAIDAALVELEANRFSGTRRVIDISGDGRLNDGTPLSEARKRALDLGVTINGLAILKELPFLDRYFRKYLIGGEGAFVMVAENYTDFAAAMARKLVREINASPLAGPLPRFAELRKP